MGAPIVYAGYLGLAAVAAFLMGCENQEEKSAKKEKKTAKEEKPPKKEEKTHREKSEDDFRLFIKQFSDKVDNKGNNKADKKQAGSDTFAWVCINRLFLGKNRSDPVYISPKCVEWEKSLKKIFASELPGKKYGVLWKGYQPGGFFAPVANGEPGETYLWSTGKVEIWSQNQLSPRLKPYKEMVNKIGPENAENLLVSVSEMKEAVVSGDAKDRGYFLRYEIPYPRPDRRFDELQNSMALFFQQKVQATFPESQYKVECLGPTVKDQKGIEIDKGVWRNKDPNGLEWSTGCRALKKQGQKEGAG